jgi:iron(III) transport system substrate-binding protein
VQQPQQHQPNRRTTLARLGAAAAASALYPVLSPAQTDPAWQKVIEEAKREGHLLLYTSAVGSSLHKEVGASFEKKYGIRFESLEARAGELRERVRAEQTAGRFIGDLHHNGSTTSALMVRDGNFQPHGGMPNLRNLVPPFGADALRVPSNVQSYGILVDRSRVKPEDEPKSWTDLLDPKWKGKILSDDMRALGGGAVFFMVMYDAFGRDFHDKLATQGLVFSRNIRNDERRTARGEYLLYIPELLPYYTDLKGLPVNLAVPKEGRPFVRFDMSVLKNAPHPNAARLFIDHFLEIQSQLVFANAGYTPVVKGVVELVASAEVKALLSTKVMGTTVPERQDEMLALAASIYK